MYCTVILQCPQSGVRVLSKSAHHFTLKSRSVQALLMGSRYCEVMGGISVAGTVGAGSPVTVLAWWAIKPIAEPMPAPPRITVNEGMRRSTSSGVRIGLTVQAVCPLPEQRRRYHREQDAANCGVVIGSEGRRLVKSDSTSDTDID